MAVTTRTNLKDSYMKLIEEFPLRRIRTAADHSKAIKIALRLSGSKDRGARDYLDVLVDLVAEYERRAGQTIDTSKVTAADLVRHTLAERGLTINSLAGLVGLPQSNLSEMLNGKRDWSKAAIRALSTRLNIPVERFIY
jgi:antitoxin component HigA of HigAB toxin-antitoxin module